MTVCACAVHVCYASACWPYSLPRPEGMLPESCQLLRSLGATDVRMAGACRRLLLVSPLHAGFWSSISWLCNLFLVGQGRGGGGCMCVDFLTPVLIILIIWICRFVTFPLYFVFIFLHSETNKQQKHSDFAENTSEQLSSPRLCLWFSPASCTEQQQGRTITFGAQRGGGWWAVELQLSHGAFLLSFQYNFD